MAMFNKTEEEVAAKAAAQNTAQRKKMQQKAQAAWMASWVGLATAAFDNGDEFYQAEIPHTSLSGFANAAWAANTKQVKRSHRGATDILGTIENAGWRLEHASWVYVQTGQNSRDKILASGQQTVVLGEVVGIYLFRRDEVRAPVPPPDAVKSDEGPEPGWYPSPHHAGVMQYWSGTAWLERQVRI